MSNRVFLLVCLMGPILSIDAMDKNKTTIKKLKDKIEKNEKQQIFEEQQDAPCILRPCLMTDSLDPKDQVWDNNDESYLNKPPILGKTTLLGWLFKKDEKKLNIEDIDIFDASLLNELREQGKISDQLQQQIIKKQLAWARARKMQIEILVEAGVLSPFAEKDNFPL